MLVCSFKEGWLLQDERRTSKSPPMTCASKRMVRGWIMEGEGPILRSSIGVFNFTAE